MIVTPQPGRTKTFLELSMKQTKLIALAMLALTQPAAADTRTETIDYYDDLSLWVLGQPKSTTCTSAVPSSTACNGNVISKTDYDWMALPSKTYASGKLQQSMTYDSTSTIASGQLGTLKSIVDGRNNTTTLSNWKRGIPQLITFADGNTKSALVDDLGLIKWVVDETGAKTCYDYDLMGRIQQITPPRLSNPAICDTDAVESNETLSTFVVVQSTEYGIPAGHWKQTVTTGTGTKNTYFDAIWQPLVVESYDSANADNTRSVSVTRYDADGRPVYQSVPTRTLSSYATSNQGTWTTYDALGRPTLVEQDSELGSRLATTIEYLTGFQRRTTDPKGNVTVESFQTFDQPAFDAPVLIDAPENLRTTIARDVFGKPTAVTRGPRT